MYIIYIILLVCNNTSSTADEDYDPIRNQQLTYDAGNTQRIIPLQINTDDLVENVEFLQAALSIDDETYPRVILDPSRATVSIEDTSPG